MNRKLKGWVKWAALAAACLLLPCVAFGATGLWEAAIVYTDQNTAIFAWNITESICAPGKYCGYEMELRHLETITFIDKYVVPSLASTQKAVPYKRSGHYKPYIRSIQCDNAGLSVNCTYSGWTDSVSDGVIVIGLPVPKAGPWLLYWRLPPPTGGGIE